MKAENISSTPTIANTMLPAVFRPCERHKPILSKMSYVQSFKEAERRMKKGQKQRQCPKCKRWYFKDEY